MPALLFIPECDAMVVGSSFQKAAQIRDMLFVVVGTGPRWCPLGCYSYVGEPCFEGIFMERLRARRWRDWQGVKSRCYVYSYGF